jgi:folate-dependent phosphoribosylglycinamide formyltransferase PurN
MKIIILTGDSLRHKYIADQLIKYNTNLDFTWIIQKRDNELNNLNNYEDLSSDLKILYKKHFEERMIAEEFFFSTKAGEFSKKKIDKIFSISKDDFLNGTLLKIVKHSKVDGLISYGCSKIDESILGLIKLFKINIHGGLSPRYKGTITHFWPTFLLEPEYTGMTVHNLSNKIDGGDILLQTSVNLEAKDGIHENACRSVKDFGDQFPLFLKRNLNNKGLPPGIPQISIGRIWINSMWHPITLKTIYNFYENKVNKFCLENRKIINVNLKSIEKRT